MKFITQILITCACLFMPMVNFAATLLPNGQQTFLDLNGKPLAGGKVYFYIPNTTTLKSTWQDSGQSVYNTNPVILDAAGRAKIYGTGAYRQVLKDANGDTVWDQLTYDTLIAGTSSWAGVVSGTANALVANASNFSSSDGQVISFIATQTNTGAATLSVNSVAINILKDIPNGPASLNGREILAGGVYSVVYDAFLSQFHLIDFKPNYNPNVIATASSTVDLGSTNTNNVTINGSGSISSFGSSANLVNPIYHVTFNGAVTLQHNVTSLILAGGTNINAVAGDSLIALYLGSGNWRVLFFSSNSNAAGSIVGNLSVSGNVSANGNLSYVGTLFGGGATSVAGYGANGSIVLPIGAGVRANNSISARGRLNDPTNTKTVTGAFNISAFVRNSLGNYTVNFTNPLNNTNYQASITNVANSNISFFVGCNVGSQTVSSINIFCQSTFNGSPIDFQSLDLMVSGGQ